MDDTISTEITDRVQLAADIVCAYVSNNSVRPVDLPVLIVDIHTVLSRLSMPVSAPVDAVDKVTPAQVRKSITPDALISFIDGKPYKTLKRHLSTHGLDFESYRARYGLPADYPTVSVNYSAARSALAKELGLGQLRRNTAAAKPAPPLAETRTAGKAPRRGRPKKTGEAAAAQ